MKNGIYEVELEIDKIENSEEKIAGVTAFIRNVPYTLFIRFFPIFID
jgi:hypothetical protein